MKRWLRIGGVTVLALWLATLTAGDERCLPYAFAPPLHAPIEKEEQFGDIHWYERGLFEKNEKIFLYPLDKFAKVWYSI